MNARLGPPATLHTDRYPHAGDLHETAIGNCPPDAVIDAMVDGYDQRYVSLSAFRLPADGVAAKPRMSWSQEKLRQYAQPQRADWGEFLRAQGFDTR